MAALRREKCFFVWSTASLLERVLWARVAQFLSATRFALSLRYLSAIVDARFEVGVRPPPLIQWLSGHGMDARIKSGHDGN